MNKTWLQTASGRAFYPLAPRVEDIHIEDIAHALANLCRFNGHSRYYSVAQHSVLVSLRVEQLLSAVRSPVVQRWGACAGLLHDAAEAYLVDLPRPIKILDGFMQYRAIEADVDHAVRARFSVSSASDELVKQADEELVATEARDLMARPPLPWELRAHPLPHLTIVPLLPDAARELFLARARELGLS